MPSLVFEQTPHGIVAVFGPGTPLDDEWDRYIAAIGAGLDAGLPARALVFAESSAPTPSQRARLDVAAAPVKARLKVAIMTTSTFVRGVVNAFALISPGYRAFAPDRVDDAITYLDIRSAHADEVHAVIARLRAQMR